MIIFLSKTSHDKLSYCLYSTEDDQFVSSINLVTGKVSHPSVF